MICAGCDEPLAELDYREFRYDNGRIEYFCDGCYEDELDALQSAINDEFEGRFMEAQDYPD